ncbi:CopG family transcriptional regulator [Bacillus wiedmannii]|uniref:CopG family transcriptional regulator n=1 Tax=Bacillus wiedmannii TaxID=1890302 RepID=UPI000BFE630C|nr:CopG family transcriptional regulator [Bacillus wiedmannii]PHE95061.1 CopG family transcriptional regulator [Bacillus wiedmannii]
MKIGDLINSLKVNNAKAVGKEIGVCDKRLLKGLKNAGYEYSRKSGRGWYFAGISEPPLKADIREFITGTDDAQVGNADNTLTKKEVSELRKMQQKKKVSRTVYLGKETCSKLGIAEDVLRINRDDIIEIALREFFEKYKAQ